MTIAGIRFHLAGEKVLGEGASEVIG